MDRPKSSNSGLTTKQQPSAKLSPPGTGSPSSPSVIQILAKSVPVSSVGPQIFLSLHRRCKANEKGSQEACVVLNCQGREPGTKNYDSVFGSKAVNVNQILPPSKTCTQEDRERCQQTLRKAVHLKTVFAYSNVKLESAVENPRSFFVRALRYLMQSNGKPSAVYLLKCAIQDAVVDPQCQALLSSPLPIYTVLIPNDGKPGLYSACIEDVTAMSSSDYAGLQKVKNALNLTAIINLSARPCPADLDKAIKVHVSNLGPQFLPLKAATQVEQFWLGAIQRLYKGLQTGNNVLLLDSSNQSFASTLSAISLALLGWKDSTQALDITRRRLLPPEADSYTKAALAHAGASAATPDPMVRLKKVIECLTEKYKVDDKQSGEGDTNTRKSEMSPSHLALLDSANTAPSIASVWADIEAEIIKSKMSVPDRDAMFSVLQQIFNNVLKNIDDAKFRTVKGASVRFKTNVGRHEVGLKIMDSAGWKSNAKGDRIFPPNGDIQRLRDVLVRMSSYNQ